ncbi:ABC transporter permease [Raineyella antarctica]|uniref:ABC transporter permease n=1 Tax=Raineyella antarctica TaxID=1577474 RepID=UPI003CCC437C
MVTLVLLAVLYSRLGDLGLARQQVVAAVRAVLQLTVVSLVIVGAVRWVWTALLFVFLMFCIAVWTAAGRAGVRNSLPWVALAIAGGVIPVAAVVFLSGASPFVGVAIIPVVSIIIGNAMTAHTLVTRRAFPALREQRGQYEAALALGFERPWAVREIIHRGTAEALVPTIDTTRTVGLVTLPGAFIGVLLGGGTPLQAGASQVLVLVGIMAANAGVAILVERLISTGRLLPPDLKGALRP